MTKRKMAQGGLAVFALAGMVVVAGCGGSSSSSGLTTGRATVVGTVEAPSAQVAQVQSPLSTVASVFAIGSRVEADGRINRQRVRYAAVVMARALDGTQVGSTSTDANGAFTFTSNIPAGTYMITATGNGPHGPITLQALITVKDGGQTTISINEATTVGAQAGAQAAANGATETEAVQTAADVAATQEDTEASDPTEVPDLHDPASIHQHAESAMMGQMHGHPISGPASTPGLIVAVQAAASQLFGFDHTIRLSPAQSHALADAAKSGTTFTEDQIATALNTALAPATALTADDVNKAITELQAQASLKDGLANLDTTKVPVLVALLLAEMTNDANVPFHISTQDQMNAYVSALVGNGQTLPGPGAQIPMGPWLGYALAGQNQHGAMGSGS